MGTVIRRRSGAAGRQQQQPKQVKEGEGANASGYLWRESRRAPTSGCSLPGHHCTKETAKTKIMKHDDPFFPLFFLLLPMLRVVGEKSRSDVVCTLLGSF